ncbi:hypothetical protein AA103196_1136 [Ameyamaea chiangmaiensis NBRC 103196]|uniref:DUF937 domain-containing protein n=1 Tax=Ameyamaea chiangmaiensis TaxID=442969 RepID=A0A850PF74_9PROT|nr:YidB family protein [Ameyamaea chiangmaiensis]MBS4075095.1 DUF937 domain-containing protein [Ameyamaea chiangmaiensis]NVN40562.1 DUF937 domain-containing protein [Ameyamaea chiangmaiensis]GBQ65485.1 hypothetical protein AA103196_1136 [Ameyamaea chiangmaiensis NBRC 103196]
MSGFLGNLVNRVLGEDSPLAGQINSHLATLLTPDNIQSLVTRAESSGLGDKVRSWIGTGENLPVSPDQIRSILGNQQVQQMVDRTGLPAETLLPALAQFLPQAVDHHTPDGTTPT